MASVQVDDAITAASVPQTERIVLHTDTFDVSQDAIGVKMGSRYWLTWRMQATTVGLVLGLISADAIYFMLVNSLTVIIEELGPSKNIVWLSLAYTLGTCTGIFLAGRLSDVFGRRWFMIGGNLLSVLGCIIACAADHVDTVIGGMILVGLGASVQINFTMAIQELVPNKDRPFWVGGIYSTAGLPMGFGPVFAQLLNTHTTRKWRWNFYIGIIFSGTAALALFIGYHPPNFHLLHVKRSPLQQLKRQDYLGILLFLGGMIVFLMGINWGGQAYPWKSAHVIATIIAGFLGLCAFVIYEVYFFKKDRLMPLHLFSCRGFVPMTGCAAVATSVAYCLFLLWPQQVAALLPGSPVQHGLLAGVIGSVQGFGYMIAALVLRYTPYHKALLIFSCMLLTALCGGMVAVQPGDQALSCSLVAFSGLAIGLIEDCSRSLLPLTCPDEDIGAALGLLSAIGYMSASIATAVYTTIYTNKAQSIVSRKVSTAALEAGLPKTSLQTLLLQYQTNITAVPGMNSEIATDVYAAAAQGQADSFRFVYYAAVAFGALAVICSLFCCNYSDRFTDDVARKMTTDLHVGREDFGSEKAGLEEHIEERQA